jgi:hypothetical protein
MGFTRIETAYIYVGENPTDEDAGKAIANFFKKEYPYKIKIGNEVIQIPGERKDRIF